MFNGTIEMNNDYHAMRSIDSIFTIMENFRKKFGLEILDIKRETEAKLDKFIFELSQTTVTFSFASFNRKCEIITYDELDKFCERYNYLNYYLTDFDFKVDDEIYYNHKMGIVTEIIDDNYISVILNGNESSKKEYKCWGMRLN